MTFKQFSVYAKLTGIFLVLLYVLVFIIRNREPIEVDLVFWTTPAIPKFWFTLGVATGGVLVFKITGGIRKVLMDYRQMRKEQQGLQKMEDKMRQELQEKDRSQEGAV